MERRPYGVYAVYDLRRWWPVLIVPLLRLLTPNRYTDLRYVVQDLLICGGLVGYSIWKWRCGRYRVTCSTDGRLYSIGVRQGILTRHALHIDAADAASVEIERTPLLWLCGGRRVRISTAGLRRRADAILYLSARQTRELFAFERSKAKRYRARVWPVFILAISGSNAAVGLLTAVPALHRIGNLIGEQLTPDAAGILQQVLHAQVPAILRSMANLLVLGWGVAALKNFLRYVGFYATAEQRRLHLVSGLFTRRDVLIDRDKITGVELRQTLLMRLLGVHTAIITAAGYGRDVGARPVLIPAADPRALCEGLERLLPEYPIKKGRVKPHRRALTRYLGPPFVALVMVAALWLAGGVWQVPAGVGMLLFAWWFFIRLLGYFSAGFGADRRAVTIWYPRGLALYRVYLPREVVDYVTITQSIWQRKTATCTVTVRCFGEKKRCHRVRGLPYEAVCYEVGQL